MKAFKILVCLGVLFLTCSSFSLFKKKAKPEVYMVGVSASFLDSVVYFTDVQSVKGVSLNEQGILLNRSTFSDQFDYYLEGSLQLKERVCFIYYATKKEKLEKNLMKIKAKYQGSVIKQVNESDFKFTNEEETE